MVEWIYEKFSFPTRIRVDKKIPKKSFEDNAAMAGSKIKALLESVEAIKLIALISEKTANINPYKDDEHDYSEISVIYVLMKKENYEKTATLIHEAIPYPTWVFLNSDTGVAISAAEKRINKNEPTKAIVEAVETTGWIDTTGITEKDDVFLEGLKFDNLPFTNTGAMWNKIFTTIKNRDVIRQTGRHIETGNDEQIEDYEKIRRVNDEITRLNDLLKKESAFGKKVELHSKIAELVSKRDSIVSKNKKERDKN